MAGLGYLTNEQLMADAPDMRAQGVQGLFSALGDFAKTQADERKKKSETEAAFGRELQKEQFKSELEQKSPKTLAEIEKINAERDKVLAENSPEARASKLAEQKSKEEIARFNANAAGFAPKTAASNAERAKYMMEEAKAKSDPNSFLNRIKQQEADIKQQQADDLADYREGLLTNAGFKRKSDETQKMLDRISAQKIASGNNQTSLATNKLTTETSTKNARIQSGTTILGQKSVAQTAQNRLGQEATQFTEKQRLEQEKVDNQAKYNSGLISIGELKNLNDTTDRKLKIEADKEIAAGNQNVQTQNNIRTTETSKGVAEVNARASEANSKRSQSASKYNANSTAATAANRLKQDSKEFNALAPERKTKLNNIEKDRQLKILDQGIKSWKETVGPKADQVLKSLGANDDVVNAFSGAKPKPTAKTKATQIGDKELGTLTNAMGAIDRLEEIRRITDKMVATYGGENGASSEAGKLWKKVTGKFTSFSDDSSEFHQLLIPFTFQLARSNDPGGKLSDNDFMMAAKSAITEEDLRSKDTGLVKRKLERLISDTINNSERTLRIADEMGKDVPDSVREFVSGLREKNRKNGVRGVEEDAKSKSKYPPVDSNRNAIVRELRDPKGRQMRAEDYFSKNAGRKVTAEEVAKKKGKTVQEVVEAAMRMIEKEGNR
jgi:hypothetical protein